MEALVTRSEYKLHYHFPILPGFIIKHTFVHFQKKTRENNLEDGK